MAPMCFLEMTDGCACTRSIVVYFLSGRLCYHCADKLECCPWPDFSRRKKEGNKSAPHVSLSSSPEAEEPPEAALAVEGLLSAWIQELRGRLCAVPLAGVVQKGQPQGTQNRGGCWPSALRGSQLSPGPPEWHTFSQAQAPLVESRAPWGSQLSCPQIWSWH